MKTLNELKVEISAIETKVLDVKGKIKAKQHEIDSFEYSCTDSDFDDYLDDGGEESTSVGSFYPSDILKSCDPIAYRCAKSDYESNYDLDDCEEYCNLKDELEELEGELESLEEELEELRDEIDELEAE